MTDTSMAVLAGRESPVPGCAFTAIRLTGLRTLSGDAEKDYDNFIAKQMGYQMDVLHGLHNSPWEFRVSLRYLYEPHRPSEVTVYFLLCMRGRPAARLRHDAVQLAEFIRSLLIANCRYQVFAAVADQAQLRRLICPFAAEDLIEICRREERVALDSPRHKELKALGFRRGAENATQIEARTPVEAEVYHVFPLTLSLENMERLCALLLLQAHPCLVSLDLAPYRLSLADQRELAEQVERCEKYAQLGIECGVSTPVQQLQPFLKKQAENLQRHCARKAFQLEDAAFLMKIHLLSSRPISPELVAIMGATITEHTGHPKSAFMAADDLNLVGGYEWYRPETAAQQHTAINAWRTFQPTCWAPSIAEPDRKHWRYLYDTTQGICAFRLPLPLASEFPGIDTVQLQELPAPPDMPTKGLLLGEHQRMGKSQTVRISEKDRARHLYVVGQTGTGKSTLFLQMVAQDIRAGNGLALIDPHGELVDEALHYIPQARLRDVIYIDPTEALAPVGINLLEQQTDLQRDYCVNYLIEVFDLLYDLKQTGGPMFEMYMRNALYLMLNQPDDYQPTLLHVPRLFQDQRFRHGLLNRCKAPLVTRFWKQEAEEAGGDVSLRNIAPYITSKLSRFVYNDTMRNILGQKHSTIDFRGALDDGKILLVDLRKGMLGDTNSHFLGMLLIGKILTAAFNRTEIRDKSRLRPFYLYVDEFQHLATPSFVSILSEARKYRLCLTVTNQYISQLKESIVHAILGNVGTLVCLRVGSRDAQLLSDLLSHLIPASELVQLPNWHAYLRLLIDGNVSKPFNIRTVLPPPPDACADPVEIIANSRRLYGRSRDHIAHEIQQDWLQDEDG